MLAAVPPPEPALSPIEYSVPFVQTTEMTVEPVGVVPGT
jgi:hypothetical protein